VWGGLTLSTLAECNSCAQCAVLGFFRDFRKQ